MAPLPTPLCPWCGRHHEQGEVCRGAFCEQDLLVELDRLSDEVMVLRFENALLHKRIEQILTPPLLDPPPPPLSQVIAGAIEQALRASHGNKQGAARILKVGRRSFYRMMARLSIPLASSRRSPRSPR